MVGEEKVYALYEDLLSAVKESFSTRGFIWEWMRLFIWGLANI